MINQVRAGALGLLILFLAPANAGRAGPIDDASEAFDRGDYATVLSLIRPLAEQGDAVAQHGLGTMYANGQGVPQNDAEAIKWDRLAADQGLAQAQSSLGYMYSSGRGVKKNDVEAVRWFRLAADQGDAPAQFNLAFSYLNGRGVLQNDAEAARWYRKSAEQGLAAAQQFLGDMYFKGHGVAQDYVSAFMWLGLSTMFLNNYAADGLNELTPLMTPAERDEGEKLLREWVEAHVDPITGRLRIPTNRP